MNSQLLLEDEFNSYSKEQPLNTLKLISSTREARDE